MLFKLGILILLTFVLIFFIFCYRFFDINTKNRFESRIVHYEDIRAGDVFLVCFESITKMVSDSMLRIQFLHPAIVIEDNGEKYVVELMNYSDKTGFHKMELDEWFSRQKHNTILLNKLDSPEDLRKEISRKVISFSQPYSDGQKKIESVGGFDSSWFKFLYPKETYVEQKIENNVTLCNEFCVYLLIKSGIVKNNKSVDNFHPDSFIGMKDFDFNDPFSYKEHYLCDLSDYVSL